MPTKKGRPQFGRPWMPDDTQVRGRERRRTERLVRRVPLEVFPSSRPPFDATTAVVNRHGALILAEVALEKGTLIEIVNRERRVSRTFTVVWCSDPVEGVYRIGVEMLDPDDTFWVEGGDP